MSNAFELVGVDLDAIRPTEAMAPFGFATLDHDR
jgi:hypothetical protein